MLLCCAYNVLGCDLQNRIYLYSLRKIAAYFLLKQFKVKKEIWGLDMWFYVFKWGFVMEWDVKVVLNALGLTMSVVGVWMFKEISRGMYTRSWNLLYFLFEILLIRILQNLKQSKNLFLHNQHYKKVQHYWIGTLTRTRKRCNWIKISAILKFR